jgi:chromosome segregation ATPase
MEAQFKARVGQYTQEAASEKAKLDTLEKQFGAAPHLDEDFKQRMGVVRGVQDNIVKSLDSIQNSTASLLQDQEKDLMRAFRARLTDLTRELEQQQSKKGDYSAELQARHRRVLSELDHSQQQAQEFDKKNQRLQDTNQKLREKLRTREDDRQCLLREVMGSKREVARLKQIESSLAKTEERRPGDVKNTDKQSAKAVEQARAQTSENPAFTAELKYREAVKRIKRATDAAELEGRKTQRRLQQMYAETPELAGLLRRSVDDVKAAVAKRRAAPPAGTVPPAGIVPDTAVSVHEFTQRDREHVMELLLSDQNAVQLLYAPLDAGDAAAEENDDWIDDMFSSKGKAGTGSMRSFHS